MLCYCIWFIGLRCFNISDLEFSLSLSSLLEPFYGTICLYNRERREKLSEDFHFHVLPTEMQDVSIKTDSALVFLKFSMPFFFNIELITAYIRTKEFTVFFDTIFRLMNHGVSSI